MFYGELKTNVTVNNIFLWFQTGSHDNDHYRKKYRESFNAGCVFFPEILVTFIHALSKFCIKH